MVYDVLFHRPLEGMEQSIEHMPERVCGENCYVPCYTHGIARLSDSDYSLLSLQEDVDPFAGCITH